METSQVTSSEHTEIAEWFAVTRPHPHEFVCGDGYLTMENERGLLFCVVDGLGHGKEALAATERALSEITEHADDALTEIMARCNEALRPTRGAVVSLAAIDTVSNILSWVGVGNVEGILFRHHEKREWLPLRPGIVGSRMPRLSIAEYSISQGDVLLMYSDGVHSRVTDGLSLLGSPEDIAGGIMSAHLRDSDDAAVLVARYHGNVNLQG